MTLLRHDPLHFEFAQLHGVSTQGINRAVKNNPDKFLKGYVISLNNNEIKHLQWKNSTAKLLSRRKTPDKAFTEKGLYMLATILKSKQATKLPYKL